MMGITKNKKEIIFKYDQEMFLNNECYFTYPLLFVTNNKGLVMQLFIPDLIKEYNELFFDVILPDLISK
ncbi:MAG: hypothetical protein PWR03_1752 [Tenuifilum sp.]|jgi:hypothetical protein|nr:hypothetical protein [Tenuifilum sp.]